MLEFLFKKKKSAIFILRAVFKILGQNFFQLLKLIERSKEILLYDIYLSIFVI